MDDPDKGKYWWWYSCYSCGYKRLDMLDSEYYDWKCPSCKDNVIKVTRVCEKNNG